MAPRKVRTNKNISPGMVRVVNTSFQGLEILLKKGSSFEGYWLEPKASVITFEKNITDVVKNLNRKKMISISHI